MTTTKGEVNKILPLSIEAEQALLGALLHNNQALEYVSDFLEDKHFSDHIHGAIYKAISYIVQEGSVADPITLRHYLAKDLAEKKWEHYLNNLAEAVVSTGNVLSYGNTIYDLAIRRNLIHIGEDLVQNAHEFSIEASTEQHIEKAEHQLFELATKGQVSKKPKILHDALALAISDAEQAHKRDSELSGYTSGFTDLDKMLGGFHPSDLVIIAGRPSMGKTGIATNIAFNASQSFVKDRTGAPVAFFSLEMSTQQLATRILSQEIMISSEDIRRGNIKAEDFPKFIALQKRLKTLPLIIDDNANMTLSTLRTRARHLKRRYNIGILVIDYLQLIYNPKQRNDSRVQEISEITRGLKMLAKDLDICIIAGSQLSRAVELRENKRPQLADLRESGSIEQDADVVMFLYREEYYEARKEPDVGTEEHHLWQQRMAKVYRVAEVLVSKQRHGSVGKVKMHFDAKFTKFSNFIEEKTFS